MPQNTQFKKIFLRREFNELAGKGYRSIALLAFIFTITITALGVALGGLNELKEKMDNPFTNWVNLPISHSATGNAMSIMDDFRDRSLLDQFLLDTIRPYREKNPQFMPPYEVGEVFNYKIRSISPEDKILTDAILLPENVLHQRINLEDRDFNCGIILSKDFYNLSPEQLSKLEKVVILEESQMNRDSMMYYLDVMAIVKELPNNCLALLPDNIYRLMGPDGINYDFINLDMMREVSFLVKSPILDLKEKIQNYFENIEESTQVKSLEVEPYSYNGFDYQLATVYFDSSYMHMDRKRIVKELKLNAKLPIQYFDKFECHVSEGPLSIERPHHLALNFAGSTQKVRALKKYVLDKYGLELSMDQVEDKENFYMVTRITTLLSILLSIFSILSIILFIYNLIKMHLEKVKSSLGTLSAFGLKQSFLLSSYTRIVSSFLCIAILFAYIFSTLLKFILKATALVNTPISVFHPLILITLLGILVLIYLISNYFIRKSLDKTPGDLIYNR
jgi:hypothetical protein